MLWYVVLLIAANDDKNDVFPNARFTSAISLLYILQRKSLWKISQIILSSLVLRILIWDVDDYVYVEAGV